MFHYLITVQKKGLHTEIISEINTMKWSSNTLIVELHQLTVYQLVPYSLNT